MSRKKTNYLPVFISYWFALLANFTKGFKVCILIALIGWPICGKSQDNRKGSFYVNWGYNRSWYSNSDIHFKGEGYDFTLLNAPATDNPEKFDANIYLHPIYFTVPQFNFRMGYFINDKYSLSLGWDHMKYFLKENIYVNISGYLEEEAHDYYHFNLNNEPFYLARNFMEYEHSDGFNYVRLNLDRYDNIWTKGKFDIIWTSGIGWGSALTWSDFSWGSKRYRNKPHHAGFNLSINAGPQFEFNNRFYLNSTFMAGQSWLYDVQIRYGRDDKATQNFQFFQYYIVAGYRFRINRKKDKSNSE